MFKRKNNKKNMSTMTPSQMATLSGQQSNTAAYNRMLGTPGTQSNLMQGTPLQNPMQRAESYASSPVYLEEKFINRVGSRPGLMNRVGTNPEQTKADAVSMGYKPGKVKRLTAASEYQRRMAGEQPSELGSFDETGFGDPTEYLQLDLGGFDGIDSAQLDYTGFDPMTGAMVGGSSPVSDGLMFAQQSLSTGSENILGRDVNNINDLYALRTDLGKAQSIAQGGDDNTVRKLLSEISGIPEDYMSPELGQAIRNSGASMFDGTLNYVDGLIAKELDTRNTLSTTSSSMPFGNDIANLDPLRTVATTVLSALPGTQQKAFTNTVNTLIAQGETEAAKEYIRNTQLNNTLTGTEKSNYLELERITGEMDVLKQLGDYLQSKGIDTGKIMNSKESFLRWAGRQSDPTVTQYAQVAQNAIDLLTRARTGAALTEAEEAFYQRMFPSLKNKDNLNQVLATGVQDMLQRQLDGILGLSFDSFSSDVLGIGGGSQQSQGVDPQIQELLNMGYTPQQLQQAGISSFNNESQTSLNGNDITALSSKFESTGDPGAIGYDSGGGMSYGTYQLAHNNVIDFINRSGLSQYFPNQDKNSKQFQATWKALAQRNPQQFEKLQKDYIMQTHYQPQAQKLAQAGIDVNSLPSSIQQAIFSTAVQHGANTNLIAQAAQRSRNNQEFLYNIYQLRANQIANGKLTPKEKQSVLNRYNQEYSIARQNLA